ncbi:MAG: class I SAM-dependent methyltransferase [Candidatus Hodarchaeota archaeon]
MNLRKNLSLKKNPNISDLWKDRREIFRFLNSEIPFFEDPRGRIQEQKYIIDNFGRIVETVRVLDQYLQPNDRLLDLGIYPGHIAVMLAKKMKVRVFGIALTTSEVFQRKIKKNQVDIIKLDLDRQDISFGDRTFQVVLCSEVVEHLDSPSHLIKEAYRILVDSGILVLTTPNIARIRNRISFCFHGISPNICPPGEYNPFSSHEWLHFREYTLDEIKKLLLENRFRVAEAKYIISQHFNENPLRTIIKRLMPKALRRGILVVAYKAS